MKSFEIIVNFDMIREICQYWHLAISCYHFWAREA